MVRAPSARRKTRSSLPTPTATSWPSADSDACAGPAAFSALHTVASGCRGSGSRRAAGRHRRRRTPPRRRPRRSTPGRRLPSIARDIISPSGNATRWRAPPALMRTLPPSGMNASGSVSSPGAGTAAPSLSLNARSPGGSSTPGATSTRSAVGDSAKRRDAAPARVAARRSASVVIPCRSAVQQRDDAAVRRWMQCADQRRLRRRRPGCRRGRRRRPGSRLLAARLARSLPLATSSTEHARARRRRRRAPVGREGEPPPNAMS